MILWATIFFVNNKGLDLSKRTAKAMATGKSSKPTQIE
ncbi:hypothetical protein SAMN05444377_11371 [Flavobacterium fontis]|uniref:Uncharacterized protein n=1 Tax=Flavobacterium fontis TaxID=1124188 RepID=A0A1M5D023_9FLAO|nr:hypothetical protein SAMN05444377_11371 [Flavobacterium fontis]